MDDIIQQQFNRYDLDMSGTLNSDEEIRQIITGIAFRLKIENFNASAVDALLKTRRGEDWNVHTFGAWFKSALRHFAQPKGDAAASMIRI